MTTRSQKITFPGANGATLAGRLELPAGPPRAFALFAHCFTCGKDSAAATRVSRALAARGFGVLRFDFTGLGSSDGEFANTSFGSNVADLVAAAEHLAQEHGAPRLLVGHSLGGAAVLVAARRIESVEAVVTIGAPSDPAHVKRHLDVAQIAADGEAEVQFGGRAFRVRREFLEDLEAQDLDGALGALGKALLVMHSPADHVVPIVHAEQIYKAARGFKSFVSLADADHLLSKASDAEYAADVLAAWAKRYVTFTPEAADLEIGRVLVEELGTKYTNRVAARGHELQADEPASLGGADAGPAPYEFLMAGLGACTSITLRMYADRKGWPLEQVSVEVEHSKVQPPQDPSTERAADSKERRDLFVRTIQLTGELDAEQRARLIEIANKCPVHKTLEGAQEIRTIERPRGEGSA